MVCERPEIWVTKSFGAILLCVAALLGGCPAERAALAPNDPHVYSLADLSIENLRRREYGSKIKIKYQLQGRPTPSFMTSYDSDELHVYARVDIPVTPAPKAS
jgi:hypothetical protein